MEKKVTSNVNLCNSMKETTDKRAAEISLVETAWITC